MGKSNRKTLFRFVIPAAALLIASCVLLLLSLEKDREYEALAKVTPIPTATVRSDVRLLVASASAEEDFAQASPVQAAESTPAPASAAVQSVSTPAPAVADTSGLLRQGSRGERVKQLQSRLKELGYYSGEVDGDFGSATMRAVKSFQKQHALDADGIVGEKTWSILNSDTAQPFEPPATAAAQYLLEGDLPFLVNKSHPVESDFVPADLVKISEIIPSDLATLQTSDAQGVREAVEALKIMLLAAKEDGITHFKVREAYRTYADQQRIFNSYVEKYVKEGSSRSSAISRTRLTVADPGTSEHHTGLAFDLNATDSKESFAYTAQYAWLYNHCWEYGFVIRYTDEKEDITGFLGEEWHYRYVGVEHAMRMRDLDMCLEEYLAYLGK